MFLLTIPDSTGKSGNVHWIVARSLNSFFTGRQKILETIEKAILDNLKIGDASQPRGYVVTGMGGQGKSELCLKVVHDLRSRSVYVHKEGYLLHVIMPLIEEQILGSFLGRREYGDHGAVRLSQYCQKSWKFCRDTRRSVPSDCQYTAPLVTGPGQRRRYVSRLPMLLP